MMDLGTNTPEIQNNGMEVEDDTKFRIELDFNDRKVWTR